MLKFFRILIVCCACGVMWLTPNSSSDFFRSLIILSMGYAYDYGSMFAASQTRSDWYHIILGAIGTAVSVMFLVIGLAGIGDILVIDLKTFMITNSKLLMAKFALSFYWLLYALMIFPLLTGFEFFGVIMSVGKIKVERR